MTKKELVDSIANKEQQLIQAKREMNLWNNGKYKKSSNSSVSKIFVSSLQDEISALRAKLLEIDQNKT
ncbi:hypothetical protein ACOIWI_004251 [Vibrio vulnificus]|uniref:hypothetical protein n=1 Tax=Vibrio metschnikovii TaxID=28172 RepID=UPI001C300D6B|nr:hypothetical protein [Vibrio metschnikovii]